ncbi:MAG: hypothetical protein USCGTAYLOR_02906 [Chromatiales bacterium USCg_Taylor]|nr:MAG: hypothetical protein USCGTAYLOR_02906 [Chromatiales bacterium USCg_Taylor]
MAAIAQRFERFGLTLHPQKPRLLDFQRPRNDGGGPRPSSFDLLGFTHYWGRSLKGHWVVKRRTAIATPCSVKSVWRPLPAAAPGF